MATKRVGRLTAALVLVGAASCIHVHVHTHETPQGGLGLEPGDRVVAHWQQAFYEATVMTVAGTLVQLAWDVPPPERSYVSRTRLSRKDDQPESLAAGAWVLCHAGTSWRLCHVDEVLGEGVTVTAVDDGTRQRAGRKQLVAVPTDLQQWAADYGGAAMKKVALQRELAELVPITAGQPAQQGQRVLARWQGNTWWLATVKGTGEAITVSWADGSGDVEIEPASIAPLASQPELLAPGQLAICAWSDSARWWRARISGRGQQSLEVEYVDGSRASVKPSQCAAARKGT